MNQVRRLEEDFGRVRELWSPKVVARVNDQFVKVAKVRGEFVWHRHEHEDELFWVVKGSLRLRFEDGQVVLGPGDLYVVPKGVLHRPEADGECWLVLVEPVETKHTGDVESPLTRSIEEQLA